MRVDATVEGESTAGRDRGQKVETQAGVESTGVGIVMVPKGSGPAARDPCRGRSHQGWDIQGTEGIAASSSRPMQPSKPAQTLFT